MNQLYHDMQCTSGSGCHACPFEYQALLAALVSQKFRGHLITEGQRNTKAWRCDPGVNL